MKNMRQLINLMEGVMAVPGVGVQPGGSESDMQTAGTAARNNSYAAFDAAQGRATEESADDEYNGSEDYQEVRAALDAQREESIKNGMDPHRAMRNYVQQLDKLSLMHPEASLKHYLSKKNSRSSDNSWENWGRDDKSARSAMNEKSTSEKQARFMAAAAHDPKFAKKAGISQGVAKEFNQADTGTKQLSKAMKHKNECSMMENGMEQEYSPEVQQAMADFENVVMNLGMAPEDAFDRITQRLSQEGMNEFRAAIEASGKFDDQDEQDVDNFVTGYLNGNRPAVDEKIELGDHDDSPAWYIYDQNKKICGGPFESEMEANRASRGYHWFNYGDHEIQPGFDVDGQFVPDDYDEINSSQNTPAMEDTLTELSQDTLTNYRNAALGQANQHGGMAKRMPGYNADKESQGVRNSNVVDPRAVTPGSEASGHAAISQKRFAGADRALNKGAQKIGQPRFEEAFDLQNGYDDINDASGNDYFPSGADSPVVKDTGPSGARQGDNPEQKKMQIDEVHKELVYGYRNFLKESAKK